MRDNVSTPPRKVGDAESKSDRSEASALEILNTPKKSSPYSEDQVKDLLGGYVVPHFHGINFVDSDVKALERDEFYSLFRDGNSPYYSEAILRNAYTDYLKRLPYWRQRLLDDFYVQDFEQLREAVSEEQFFELQQQYVNMYKSCYGPTEKKFLTEPKNLFAKIEEGFKQDSNLRDLNSFAPSVRAEIENLSLRRKTILGSLADLRGKRNKKEEREALEKELSRINSRESSLMQKHGFDPFVAMSKLPRHATMFALSAASFEVSYAELEHRRDGYLFLGFVICSMHNVAEYNQSVHHDSLVAARLGKESLNAHYKNQTEVDFHHLDAGVIKFSMPVILIKKNNSQEVVRRIREKFNLSDAEYCSIVDSIFFKNGTMKKCKTVFENLTNLFSQRILDKAKEEALNNGQNLVYVTPLQKLKEFERGEDVMEVQRKLIYESEVSSEKLEESNWQTTLSERVVTRDIASELTAKAIEVDEEIFASICGYEEVDEAREKLVSDSECQAMEQYELTCVDRLTNLSMPRGLRTERDEKLAEMIQAREDKRCGSFREQQEFQRLSSMVSALVLP